MLIEREVDARSLFECIASYLVLSTTNKLDPHYNQIWTCCLEKQFRRHEVIEQPTLFGVEHDDRYETFVQAMTRFEIALPAVENSSRHEVIVHCILLDVEHDERCDPSVRDIVVSSSLAGTACLKVFGPGIWWGAPRGNRHLPSTCGNQVSDELTTAAPSHGSSPSFQQGCRGAWGIVGAGRESNGAASGPAALGSSWGSA